jgi:Beige/BEACH domain/PH domain associated with Beige/BEACH
MDKEYCRPLLRVSSENYAYLQGHMTRIKTEIGVNPNFIARDSKTMQEDEESDYNIEEENTSRASLKGTEPKESLLIQVNVGIMQPLTTSYGILQLITTKTDQKIRFPYEDSVKEYFNNKVELFQYIPSQNKSSVKEWKVENLVNVMPQSFVMQHTAAEFFFDDGRTVLIQFQSHADRLGYLSLLKKCKRSGVPKLIYFKLHNSIKLLAESGITEKWANWQISNFEYLMHLNFASGRSFSDLAQYPILPWVLNDYSSKCIDLNSKSVYRDLSKNMGSLGKPERIKYFKERYNNFFSDTGEPAFHFGLHYSNPGII